MLKYQVRTLNRGEARRRKSILDQTDHQTSSSSSSSPSSSKTSSPLHPPLSPSVDGGWRKRTEMLMEGMGNLRVRGRSSSVSSLSSAGSSNESPLQWGTIKVHTDSIRPDTDYKTFFVSTGTTAGDLVRMALSKFRLGFRDPKLFHISMILRTKNSGSDVETSLVLDPSAKPLELQACHPREKSRFILQMRPGTPIRIFDFCILPESNYKSILVSPKTTCAEAVALVLQSHRLPFASQNFVLVCLDTRNGYEYILPPEAFLVDVEESGGEECQIHLRSFSQARLSLSHNPSSSSSSSSRPPPPVSTSSSTATITISITHSHP